MPDQDRVSKIETVHNRIQIVRPGVDVVSGTRLIGVAVTPPVVGDRSVAFAVEEKHLCFPCSPGQWPAVREDDRWALAPITIVDLGTVTGCDPGHGCLLNLLGGRRKAIPALTRARRWTENARVHSPATCCECQ